MSAIDLLLQQPAVEAVGWALLQFIWQGALVGILTALALFALRRSAADVRYVVSAIGLSLMLTMPVMTAVQTWRTLEEAHASLSAGPARPAAATAARESPDIAAARETAPVTRERVRSNAPQPSSPSAVASAAAALDRPNSLWLAVTVIVWLGGVAALSLRLLMGWLLVRRMTRRGTSPVPVEWQAVLSRLARQLHVTRPIQLLRSVLVDVPTVIGWLRPVVLLPSSALAGLAPQQLEAILAHELAHIRRHDYLVNLLQTLVETLLFYHPAVWWLSHRIRVERENCCDDLAVDLCGDPYAYARALADLEQMRGGEGRLVLAATGGSLVHRVRRVLGASSHAGRGPGWLAGSAAVVVIAGIAAGALGRNVVLARQSTDPVAQPVVSAPIVAAVLPSTSIAAAVVPATPAPRAAQPEPPVRPVDLGRFVTSIVENVLEQFGYPPVPPVPPAAPVPPVPARRAFPPPPPPPPPMAVYAVPPTPPAAPVPPVPPPSDSFVLPPLPPSPALAAVPPVPAVAAGPPMAVPPPPAVFAQPAPPVPPAPPEVPFAKASPGQRARNISWSNDKDKLEVRYEGEIEFTDDDKDVKSLSDDGFLRIRQSGRSDGDRSVEFRADSSGTITRRYWEGSSERPFEPAGRRWLADVLPRFIRQTGIGAPRRVAAILAAKGPSGVLAEISEIEGSFAKRIYFSELLKTKLDPAVVRQALSQAGKEINSDFELASLLMSTADRLLVDDGTRRSYLEAAKSIGSDFEMQRVFSAALKGGAFTPAIMAELLDASNAIGSNFEHARLLLQVVDLQPIEGPVRDPFFRALATVGSAFEHGRVLQALAKRPDLSAETVLAVLKSAQMMGSNFEIGQVLRAVADKHEISGEARTAYIDAASRLGNFEEGRALTALVKSERRR
jgi:beta-lactamase regulating signal transducer with metallopeptidase domain